MVDNVVPEDGGTGAGQGDFNDAAHFGQMINDPGQKDRVISGLNFQNVQSDSVDITQGVFRAFKQQAKTVDHGSGQRTIRQVSFTAQVDSRTGISLSSNAVNFVFLRIDLDNNNDIRVTTNTTGSAPNRPRVLLGTVDTGALTSTPYNRDFGYKVSSVPVQKIPDGNFAAADYRVRDGETMVVKEVGIVNTSQNAPSGLTAQVQVIGTGTELSRNTKKDVGGELAKVAGPADVQFRVDNATGGKQSAGGTFGFVME